ncbi:MAG: helix-turn-helix transcriptional regulator [Acidimicrobiales bacterium]
MAKSPVALGEALTTARKRVGYSVEAICNLTSLREHQLYEIEAGLVEPSSGVVDRLAELYGIRADQLPLDGEVPRKPLSYDPETKQLHAGWLSIEFDPTVHTNDDLLRAFSACVRQLRGESTSSSMILRDSDRTMLAELLNLTDEHLEQRFSFWFKSPIENFAGLRSSLSELV